MPLPSTQPRVSAVSAMLATSMPERPDHELTAVGLAAVGFPRTGRAVLYRSGTQRYPIWNAG